MISRCITASQVRLASDVADEFFPNIKGDQFRDDVSWLATLRALLPSRLGVDVAAQIRYLEKETPSKKSRAQRVEYFLEGVDVNSPNTITAVNIKKTTEDLDKLVDAFRHNGVADHEFQEKIFSRYYDQEQKGYVLIYSNHDIANTVIFTSGLTISMWHTLQGFMRSAYFKKAFEAKPVTEDEMALLRVLASEKGENGMETYLALMQKFEEPYDFRSAIIRKSLVNFTVSAKKSRIAAVENTIRNATDKIDRYKQDIGRQLAIRDKAQVELYGLKFAVDEDKTGQELTEYFLNNHQLIFTDVTDGSFNYWVKGQLTYWDEQDAESYIATKGGYLYAGCRAHNLDTDKFQQMLKDIFIDRKIRVLMCAAYQFHFDDSRIDIEINSGASVPAELRGYIMNPHSMGNSCWGDHSRNLEEALSMGDYASAVGVTINAACQLTLHDVSTDKFSNWLAESRQNCLLLPDGSRMTCKQYLETL